MGCAGTATSQPDIRQGPCRDGEVPPGRRAEQVRTAALRSSAILPTPYGGRAEETTRGKDVNPRHGRRSDLPSPSGTNPRRQRSV